MTNIMSAKLKYDLSFCTSDKIYVCTNSLTLVRQEDLETDVPQEPVQEPSEWKYKDFEDDDLLLLFVDKCFPLVDSESNPDNPSDSCYCQFNENVVMPERAEIAYSTQIARLCKERNNLYLKSFQRGKYISPSNKEISLEDTMSAKITIYSQVIEPLNTRSGVPVLLNFTGTDNFFTCTKQGEERILTVMWYDINKLQCISSDDTEKWSCVFFMSQTAFGLCRFESALHRGWFIHTVDSDVVKMQRRNLPGIAPLNTFFFLIDSETTKIIRTIRLLK